LPIWVIFPGITKRPAPLPIPSVCAFRPSTCWCYFCHHNVHHQRPGEPWHRLPALERQLYPAGLGAPRVVPFARQVRDFFRYRVARVMAPAGDTLDSGGDPNVGAAGVAFLTAL